MELCCHGLKNHDHSLFHGGLLSLNAWKVGPPPRKIEMVYMPHSNEHDNRCPLEPAMLLSS